VTKVAQADIDTALAFIHTLQPDADVLRLGVADAHDASTGRERTLYLSAEDPEALRRGCTYVTWVVAFRDGAPVQLSSFVSTACRTGGRADE
jgi:hypothetical protein